MKNIIILIGFIYSISNLTAQTINYTYDNLGRVTKIAYPDDCTINYTYDASGNRMSSIITNLCFSSPKPTITPSGPIVFCEGDSVTLTSSESANYIWSTGEATQKIVVKKAGSYIVTAVLSPTCSKLSDPITITVNPRPKAVITASKSVLCVGDVAELKAETANNQTYRWSTGSTSTSILVNNNGVYKLFVTNSFGCTDSTSITLTFNSLPIALTGGDVNLCEYSRIGVQLGSPAISGNTYSWSPATGLDDSALSNPIANPSVTTTYTLNVTSAFGCISAASAKVTMLPTPTAPTLGLITQPTCEKVTGSVIIDGLPPNGNWILTRTPGEVTTNGTGISLIVSGLIPYTYSYAVTGTSGCTSLPSADIVIDAQPKTPVAPVTITANSITQTNLTANWNSSSSATGYSIDVSDNIGFTTFLAGYQDKDIGNVLTCNITGLTPFKSYYYRVRSYSICGISSNSGIITATTLPDPPVAPNPLSATDIIQTSIIASWNPLTSATGYRLDVATNPGFTTFVTGFNDKDMNNITTISITGLTANTTYYYRIKAYNTGGTSPVSGTITTTTLPNPPEPAIANLASNIVQSSFTANWNPSITATGYRLDVATNIGFTTFVTGYNDTNVSNVTTISINGLTENKTYFYRVRAYNTGGTSSNSNTISLATLPNPPIVPIANPATNVVQNSFIADWSPSPTATGYRLDVATNPGFTTFVTGFSDKDMNNVTTISITGLIQNTTYYYRVKAYNTGGTSASSGTITTTTLPNPPETPILNLASNILQTSFTANWNPSVAATGYRLDVATNIGFTTFVSEYHDKDVSNVTTTSVSGLTANTTYYFRVKAYNTGGTSSNSSTITLTTLPNPPVAPIANPATLVVQSSFNANWSTSPGATGYRLDVATNSGFTNYLSGYSDKDIGNVTSFPIIGLTARTTYYYRLRAYNTGGTSGGTNTVTVKTLSMPPNVPTGLTAKSCNNQVTLTWRQNSDPYFGRYRIFGGLTSNPTIKMDSTTNSASDTLKIISGLVNGQTYFFRVSAVNDDGPESTISSQSSVKIKTGVVPTIKAKYSDVLICYNLGDSIKKYQWYKGSSLIPNAIGQYYTTKKSPGVYSVETIDKEGCKNISSQISISGTKSISVSPNPASVSFELRIVNPSEEKADVSIFNSAGVKVMEFQAQNVKDEVFKAISVSHLADGVYIVQVLLNDELLSTKILVKK